MDMIKLEIVKAEFKINKVVIDLQHVLDILSHFFLEHVKTHIQRQQSGITLNALAEILHLLRVTTIFTRKLVAFQIKESKGLVGSP